MDKLVKLSNSRDGIVKDKEKYDEILAVLFVNNLALSLPEPDMSKLKMQQDALDTFTSMVDNVYRFSLMKKLWTMRVSGKRLASYSNDSKTVRNILIRNYMIDNNILPEAFKLIFEQSDEISQLDLLSTQQTYLDSIRPILRDYAASSWTAVLRITR